MSCFQFNTYTFHDVEFVLPEQNFAQDVMADSSVKGLALLFLTS